MTTTALYARISNDPTGLRAGVDRQETDCRSLAEREGWTVAETFVDNDLSAYSGKPRPGYMELIDAIRERRVEAVVAWHPDRLHRSPLELEGFIDLIHETGAQVTTVQAGSWDLSSPSGRLAARQLGAVARYESEHRSERIRRKMVELAEAGKDHGGGTRPYGFDADRHTVRADEAERIREAVEHVRAGGTLVGLATRWNREGVPTVTGAPWRTPTLKRLLTSARIAGMREHNGSVVAEATWPAIVPREAWEEARAILGARPRRRGPGNGVARTYLLAGIAVCGLCGARLVARPRPGGARAYVCASGPNFDGCGKIRRVAEPVEEHVRDLVLERLDGPGLAEVLRDRAGDDRQARQLATELGEYQVRLEALGEAHFVEGVVDRPEYLRARSTLQRRIEDCQSALARRAQRRAVSGVPTGGESLGSWWKAAELDRRRALVGLVIERVVVHPAVRGRNRFDPSLIEPIWRVEK